MPAAPRLFAWIGPAQATGPVVPQHHRLDDDVAAAGVDQLSGVGDTATLPLMKATSPRTTVTWLPLSLTLTS